ncbi:nitroreductase [Acidovorax sp.]|uniref:nitroreductase family protein n=1 Tax=Acidovorax sp. TaxID=1872122 RepID=UPI00391D18C0
MAVIPWPLNPSSLPAAAPVADDAAGMAAALIHSRQTILPKRLGSPGPAGAELLQILQAAAHAPDHGQLVPWRFILVPEASRKALADVFAQALRERDPAATPQQAEQAREKAYRSPVLLLAVVDAERGDADIDLAERTVSAGCAVQNMLLMATAQGYGSALTSGKALKADSLRALFQLAPSEQALCFISIGTVQSRKAARARPAASTYVSTLGPHGDVAPGF